MSLVDEVGGGLDGLSQQRRSDGRGGRALIAEEKARALRGEMLWASYWEKLQLSPAAPRA